MHPNTTKCVQMQNINPSLVLPFQNKWIRSIHLIEFSRPHIRFSGSLVSRLGEGLCLCLSLRDDWGFWGSHNGRKVVYVHRGFWSLASSAVRCMWNTHTHMHTSWRNCSVMWLCCKAGCLVPDGLGGLIHSQWRMTRVKLFCQKCHIHAESSMYKWNLYINEICQNIADKTFVSTGLYISLHSCCGPLQTKSVSVCGTFWICICMCV